MADAVRRYGRVFSGGSQRVLGDYGDWPRLIWGGVLGEIKEVYVDCGGPSGDCYLPETPIPAGLDWEMWLGPAPWRPFHPSLIKGGFRPYRDYSGGGMTDWGAHRFGAALFAVGLHLTGPTEVIPPDGKEHKMLTYRFANGLRMYHGGTKDIHYKGTEGELFRGGPPPRQPAKSSAMPTYKGKGGIFGDFLHCVKTREKPFRNIEVAHRACTVCHLGNIAYWLNRPLKWDPVKEEIVGDAEANRWLDRPKRETVEHCVGQRERRVRNGVVGGSQVGSPAGNRGRVCGGAGRGGVWRSWQRVAARRRADSFSLRCRCRHHPGNETSAWLQARLPGCLPQVSGALPLGTYNPLSAWARQAVSLRG